MSLWADSGTPRAFGSTRKGPGHLEAVERLKDWTRERFALTEDDTVLVSEAASSLPGCPPVETVVAFWTGGHDAHHFKVFKPADQVGEEDIPPAWMKEALSGVPGITCSCC